MFDSEPKRLTPADLPQRLFQVTFVLGQDGAAQVVTRVFAAHLVKVLPTGILEFDEYAGDGGVFVTRLFAPGEWKRVEVPVPTRTEMEAYELMQQQQQRDQTIQNSLALPGAGRVRS